MSKNLKAGFTLIELLVVIAIIGILAAVVLTNLNTAQDQGNDASAQSSLSSARAQAQLYYNSNSNSYGTCSSVGASDCVCTTADGENGIGNLVNAADDATDGDTATCHAADNSWAAGVDLNNGDSYCADSSGFSGIASSTPSSASCN